MMMSSIVLCDALPFDCRCSTRRLTSCDMPSTLKMQLFSR